MTALDTEKLWSLIKPIGIAMLTTLDGGTLRARPMAASQQGFDGTLWFFTSAAAHKVDEVDAAHQVGITYAEPKTQTYISLSGTARLVRDRSAIDAHWSEALATWFPKGKDDPDIALLQVEVEQAEYWDAPNSTLLHAYGYVKAKLTGSPPAGGENVKMGDPG